MTGNFSFSEINEKMAMIELIKKEYSRPEYSNLPHIYYYVCGCQSIEKDSTHGVIHCPTHKWQRVEKILHTCQHCGKQFFTVPQGYAFYCVDCARIKRSLASKLSYYRDRKALLLRSLGVSEAKIAKLKKKVEIRKKKKKDYRPPINYDCKHYLSKCLIEVCKNGQSEYVNCKGCKEYEKQELDILDFITCKGSYDA